jgi:hypothetical protein
MKARSTQPKERGTELQEMVRMKTLMPTTFKKPYVKNIATESKYNPSKINHKEVSNHSVPKNYHTIDTTQNTKS